MDRSQKIRFAIFCELAPQDQYNPSNPSTLQTHTKARSILENAITFRARFAINRFARNAVRDRSIKGLCGFAPSRAIGLGMVLEEKASHARVRRSLLAGFGRRMQPQHQLQRLVAWLSGGEAIVACGDDPSPLLGREEHHAVP